MDESTSTGSSPEIASSAPERNAPLQTQSPPPAPFSIRDLQKLSSEQLEAFARKADIHLYPGRSRHFHILDVIKVALQRGGTVTVDGFLDDQGDAGPVLRSPEVNFLPGPEDVSVPRGLVQKLQLRPGQHLAGTVRLPRDREKLLMLDEVTMIEGGPAAEWSQATDFEKLTPQFPQGRIYLENPKTNSISARAIDLLTPLGRGQRGLIVAPPRVGKTILLKEIAKAIRVNHPEIVLILLLVDERPEEV